MPSAMPRPFPRTGRSINAGFFTVFLAACLGNTPRALMSEIIYGVIQTITRPAIRNFSDCGRNFWESHH